jgi:hypothetical protein
MTLPEINLDSVPGTSTQLVSLARKPRPTSINGTADLHRMPDLLAKRADADGLPFRMGLDCQLGKESTESLQVLSRKLRTYLSETLPRDNLDTRHDVTALREKLLAGKEGEWCEWLQTEAVPTLTQLLQVEERPVRSLLVELLSRIKGRAATITLAQRALFDISEEVREAAVLALQPRSSDDYRPVFLEGLRHPWAPVADHAAEALVMLDDKESLPKLLNLMVAPDPRQPRVAEDHAARLVVRELVRVNHLQNCLLCHAPSLTRNDPVRGLVPTPGQALPPPTTPYYEGNSGPFVRADITYLKQDFSVLQPVANAGVWPMHQRYDYVVRDRLATRQEIDAARDRPRDYPQLEAVRFALTELRRPKE